MTSSNAASAAEVALRIAREDPGVLLAIVGPTASGKTALAIEISERLQGEVVSADSVQIYREFEIGSGRPTASEMARAPHHLVGAIDPRASVDAASWAAHAARIVDDIRARGRMPLVCGGTFLWVKALLYGLAETPGADASIRDRHRATAAETGRASLHRLLHDVDPVSAARLHPNDLVRVSRALEVYELTGRTMSSWQAEHGFARPLRRVRLLALRRDGGALTERIEQRARAWLAGGWIEEVEGLLERGFGDARAMGSVGYAQIRAMLSGALDRADLLTAIVRATRIFARRQRTWLNRADVTWLE